MINLYLQRKDRRPHLKIRVRYEYRAGSPEVSGEDDASPRIHDDSQERLYMLLGDFLKEHGIEYPQGTSLVRFALSNEGERTIYIDSVRLALRTIDPQSGERLVFDPTEERLIPAELAEGTVNILSRKITRHRPLELVPGDAVGYRFKLVRLANTLKAKGYLGKVRMTLEASDRLGNVHRCPFEVDTDLWAYFEEQDSSGT